VTTGDAFVALCDADAGVGLAFGAAVDAMVPVVDALRRNIRGRADVAETAGAAFDRLVGEVERAEGAPVDEHARKWLREFVGAAAEQRWRERLD
jgi:hypothetical protein